MKTKNSVRTTKKVASNAGTLLSNPNTPKKVKSVAASAVDSVISTGTKKYTNDIENGSQKAGSHF